MNGNPSLTCSPKKMNGCVFDVLLHPKHSMKYEQCVAEITQITNMTGGQPHTNWLSLSSEFCKWISQVYCCLVLI